MFELYGRVYDKGMDLKLVEKLITSDGFWYSIEQVFENSCLSIEHAC